MSVVIAVPDETLRGRLSAIQGAELIVWDFERAPAPRPIDLLVLPYMLPPEALTALRGRPVGVVQSQMLGYDGVRNYLPDGMTFCNAVEVHEASTAELALALVLADLRGLTQLAEAQREGRWAHQQFPGLAGRSVLLIGVGGVGQQIEARLAPFECTVTKVARTARSDVHAFGDLPDLLPAADIVILAVPLTDETRGFVSDDFLGAMGEGALLVNVSRGPVVDTAALARRLSRGGIRAALDVTDPEPLPPGHPLWTTPGVTITPHVGGHTGAMADRIDRLIREQVRRFLAQEFPANIVIGASGQPRPDRAPRIQRYGD